MRSNNTRVLFEINRTAGPVPGYPPWRTQSGYIIREGFFISFGTESQLKHKRALPGKSLSPGEVTD